MRKLIPFLFLLISANFSTAQNRTINFDHSSFAEILARAKKENKMIYVDCYTSWCGPCKWMAKNVFTNDTVADFFNKNFINAKIDMENGEGIEIAKRYDIRAYPTMLYLSSDGVQLHRTCGSSPARDFISNAENALVPAKQLATYAANFKDGNVTAAFASSYLSMLETACQANDEALKLYFSHVGPAEIKSRANWQIIYNYVEDYSSKPFQALEHEKEAFSKAYTADSVDAKIVKVYTSGLYSALQNKDFTGYENLKTKLRATKTKDAEKVIMESDIRLYVMNKDWTKYAAAGSEYINKYAADNANELNSFAWTFYENIDDKVLLEKAIAWSKKAVELENNYPYNDTYAAVLYKAGKKAEAEAAALKAIEIAKKNGDDFKETQTLLEKIKMLK